MNRINPEKLLNSKWTAVEVSNREKHFIVTELLRDVDEVVVECVIEAVMTKSTRHIEWRELRDSSAWKMGWK